MDVPDATIAEARQDVLIATELFEEKARKLTWYFAWREGEEIVPEKVKLHEKSFNRLFLETQVLLTFVFIALGLGLFVVVSTFYPDYFWACPNNSDCFTIRFRFLLKQDNCKVRRLDNHQRQPYHTLLGISAASWLFRYP